MQGRSFKVIGNVAGTAGIEQHLGGLELASTGGDEECRLAVLVLGIEQMILGRAFQLLEHLLKIVELAFLRSLLELEEIAAVGGDLVYGAEWSGVCVRG